MTTDGRQGRPDPVGATLSGLLASCRSRTDGQVADYIPELLEAVTGRPANPMINAGAIVTSAEQVVHEVLGALADGARTPADVSIHLTHVTRIRGVGHRLLSATADDLRRAGHHVVVVDPGSLLGDPDAPEAGATPETGTSVTRGG